MTRRIIMLTLRAVFFAVNASIEYWAPSLSRQSMLYIYKTQIISLWFSERCHCVHLDTMINDKQLPQLYGWFDKSGKIELKADLIKIALKLHCDLMKLWMDWKRCRNFVFDPILSELDCSGQRLSNTSRFPGSSSSGILCHPQLSPVTPISLHVNGTISSLSIWNNSITLNPPPHKKRACQRPELFVSRFLVAPAAFAETRGEGAGGGSSVGSELMRENKREKDKKQKKQNAPLIPGFKWAER